MAEQHGPLEREQYARMATEDHAAARTEALERIKIQYGIADATLKALMLANGGAMIALFTFIGNLMAKSAVPRMPFSTHALWVAFACFVAGLVTALICHGLAFMSQDRFFNQVMREAWRMQDAAVRGAPTQTSDLEMKLFRQGQLFYFGGLATSLVSVVCFATGCGFALSGVLIR